jgi:acyl-coenzyme A thioesterase PaaI-like protein
VTDDFDHAQRRRATDALRLLMQRLVATDAPESLLGGAADELEALAARLAPHQLDDRQAGLVGFGSMETHPLTGPSNGLAPPLVCEASHGRSVVTGTYGHAFEGPTGRLHGGFVAAGLDLALGRAVGSTGQLALTGTLSVRFRKATPLFVPVRYEAEVGEVDGRKITVSGRLTADGEVTAEAQGLWIVVAAAADGVSE